MLLSAKVHLGKAESVSGHVLVITPTGSSAFTAGGTTWQAALNKSKNKKNGDRDGETDKSNLLSEISQYTSGRLQKKMRSVRLVIIDEVVIIFVCSWHYITPHLYCV